MKLTFCCAVYTYMIILGNNCVKKVEYAGTVLKVGTWHPGHTYHYHTSPTLRMRPDFGCEMDEVMLWAVSVTSSLLFST